MDTKFILLWLEAPLQSWGYDSKFNRRDTLDFPTKSGVLGLVFCALGASGEQIELLSRFAKLKQTVISYRYVKNGRIQQKQPFLRDFQMIGAGYNKDDFWENMLIPKKSDGKAPVGEGTKITHRYYLQNVIFSVLLEVPSDLAGDIGNALKFPAYPLYLGRRCCIPTDFIFRGIYSNEEEARFAAKKIASEKSLDKNDVKENLPWKLEEDFMVIDGESMDGDAFTLNDVPIQFGSKKKYRDRIVTKVTLSGDD